jgi:hypothetical protein
MRTMSPRDLTGKVRNGDRLLRTRREVAKLDLARGQLVADDDSEMGMVPCRHLELLPELPSREICPGRDPG